MPGFLVLGIEAIGIGASTVSSTEARNSKPRHRGFFYSRQEGGFRVQSAGVKVLSIVCYNVVRFYVFE